MARIVKIDPENLDQTLLREAADILAKGGLVIIPTETVYGVAADMLNKNAVSKLYKIKERPLDKPFTLHIAEKKKAEEFAVEIPVPAYKLMHEFWPGPLTIVFKAAGGSSIGLRMPSDKIALEVISLAGVPVVCPSANISGEAAPVDFGGAIKDLGGLVDFAIDGGRTKLGTESTVVDFSSAEVKVLREGAISKKEIDSVLKRKTILFVCTGNSCRSVMAKEYLEKILKSNKREDVEVLSAGTSALGLGATEATRNILKKEGIDVSAHHSQRVTKEMLKRSDFILAMEQAHEETLLDITPGIKSRLFLLKEFAKINDANLNITDPIGSTEEFYEETFKVIKEAVKKVSEII